MDSRVRQEVSVTQVPSEAFDGNLSTDSVEEGKYSPINFYSYQKNNTGRMRSSSPIPPVSSSRNTSSSENALNSSSSEEFSILRRSQSEGVALASVDSKGVQVNARDLPPKRKAAKATGANGKKKEKSTARVTRSKSKLENVVVDNAERHGETESISPIQKGIEGDNVPIHHQETIYEQSTDNVLALEERQGYIYTASNDVSEQSENPTEEANFVQLVHNSTELGGAQTKKRSLTLKIVGMKGSSNNPMQPLNIVIPSDNEINTVNIAFNHEGVESPKVQPVQTEEKHTSPMQFTSNSCSRCTPKSQIKMEKSMACSLSRPSKSKSKSLEKKKVNNSKRSKKSRRPSYSDSSFSEYDSSDCSCRCDCSDCCETSSDYSSASSEGCCWEKYKCAPKKQTKKKSTRK